MSHGSYTLSAMSLYRGHGAVTMQMFGSPSIQAAGEGARAGGEANLNRFCLSVLL